MWIWRRKCGILFHAIDIWLLSICDSQRNAAIVRHLEMRDKHKLHPRVSSLESQPNLHAVKFKSKSGSYRSNCRSNCNSTLHSNQGLSQFELPIQIPFWGAGLFEASVSLPEHSNSAFKPTLISSLYKNFTSVYQQLNKQLHTGPILLGGLQDYESHENWRQQRHSRPARYDSLW